MSSSMTDPQRFAVYQFLNDNADNEAPRNKGARIVAEQIHETTGYKLNPKTVYHMICAFGLQKHYLTRTLPTRQKQPEQAEQTEQQDLLAEDLGERVKTMEASMSTLFKVSQRLDAELAEVRKSLSNHKTNMAGGNRQPELGLTTTPPPNRSRANSHTAPTCADPCAR
jgi:hypothetical protein